MITLRKNTFVYGDVHSDVTNIIAKLEANEFPAKSDIVFLGDCGFWDAEEIPFQFFALMDALEAVNCRALFLRGNHDNPEIFKTGLRTKHFVLLKDLEEVRYGTKLGLIYPGAVSIDRYWKSLEMLPGNEWFPEEVVPNASEVPAKHYDFVLSHTGPRPAHVGTEILKYFSIDDKNLYSALIKEQSEIAKMLKKVKPEVMMFGHYHTSTEFTYEPTKTTCIACSVKELKPLPLQYTHQDA